MDIWYFNGWVAFPQFVFGFLFFPLAATMIDTQVADIPKNLWEGLQCFLAGTNFITRDTGFDCDNTERCGGYPAKICCDSCDGSIPQVSALPALTATSLYMTCNIAYNMFLVLVIKHGSAALMYATAAVVLPLGAIAFTFQPFMGFHAQDFDVYNGVGLFIVLMGMSDKF